DEPMKTVLLFSASSESGVSVIIFSCSVVTCGVVSGSIASIMTTIGSFAWLSSVTSAVALAEEDIERPKAELAGEMAVMADNQANEPIVVMIEAIDPETTPQVTTL